ncbi:peptidylprolyl isomerase [Halostella sp. JP-L12]|uniref:FKBP-type peptidyl-prolyl cis-trans isomerase n=1 Tax=Halostella TaxID=1843185 RepID=UPI000EF77DD7|nr:MULTISPECIES: peptidylprolyl isomerase [Halostella]NHN48807.1 peptidylprolyl isomerase [Halostella sp. JP-L12]
MSEDQEADQADEADAAESEEEVEQEEGLQQGDFVRLDYTARTADGGQLVDTTDPDVAEEEGVDDQQQTFEPRVVVLGEGHIFEAVEEDIYGEEVGTSGSVTVPAEEAFGEHDEEEVRTVSADKIPEDDRYPGAHVDVDGQHGHVETIIGGRARVDFNHPLAGEDVEYDYEVLEEVEDRVEQAKGLIGMYVDVDLDMWIQTDEVEEEVRVDDEDDDDEESEPEFETQTVEKETLYIESTPQLAMNQQWMMSKQQVAQDVVDRLDLDRIIVQETLGEGAGMMGGLGGMMGGGMGGGDIEEALEDADVDADEIVDELEGAEE